jgi:hypothetical protein
MGTSSEYAMICFLGGGGGRGGWSARISSTSGGSGRDCGLGRSTRLAPPGGGGGGRLPLDAATSSAFLPNSLRMALPYPPSLACLTVSFMAVAGTPNSLACSRLSGVELLLPQADLRVRLELLLILHERSVRRAVAELGVSDSAERRPASV